MSEYIPAYQRQKGFLGHGLRVLGQLVLPVLLFPILDVSGTVFAAGSDLVSPGVQFVHGAVVGTLRYHFKVIFNIR